MTTPPRTTPRLAALLVAVAALAACRIANEDATAAGSTDAGAGGGITYRTCAAAVDCVGACPGGSLGCACVPMPVGPVCVPTCFEPADCPEGLTCDRMGGICIAGGMGAGGQRPGERDGGTPPGPGDGGAAPHPDAGGPPPGDGGPGPKACAANDECTGACPQGSKACACEPTPDGPRCVPTCGVPADCPVIPGGPQFTCNAGVCVPQKP